MNWIKPFIRKSYRTFLALLYICCTLILHFSTATAEFYDTEDYERISHFSITSTAFWTDRKPATGPLMYKIFARNPIFISIFQWLLSTASWLVFAYAITRLLNRKVLKILAFTSILAFSLSPHTFIWNSFLLSEGPATALFLLVLAAWIYLVEKLKSPKTPPGFQLALMSGFLMLTALWSFFRDLHMYFVLSAGISAFAVLLIRLNGWQLAFLGAGFISIFTVQNNLSHTSGRWTDPLAHVITKRILPNREAAKWFVDHGMPDGPQIQELSGKFASPEEQARFEPWLTQQGKRVYGYYLLSHPVSSIWAPLDNLEQLFDRDLSTYARWKIPTFQALLGKLFFSPILNWLIAFGLVFGMYATLAGYLDYKWQTPIILIIFSYPLLFISWHGDTMEIARHAYGANLQTRLGLLLGWWMAVDGLLKIRDGRKNKSLNSTPESAQ